MILSLVIIILSLLGGDLADLNNYIEIALWLSSIAGILSMRKWGAALSIFTLSYTASTSMNNLIYYLAIDPDLWPNAVRVAINIPIIVYLFSGLFKAKFK